MMKQIIIVVSYCPLCLHNHRNFCELNSVEIEEIDLKDGPFPHWCPLTDYPDLEPKYGE